MSNRRNRQTEKDNKTEIVMGIACLIATGAVSKTTSEPIKRSVAYINITDLVSDIRLDEFDKDPSSILKWLSKFELVVTNDQQIETVSKGSID